MLGRLLLAFHFEEREGTHEVERDRAVERGGTAADEAGVGYGLLLMRLTADDQP